MAQLSSGKHSTVHFLLQLLHGTLEQGGMGGGQEAVNPVVIGEKGEPGRSRNGNTPEKKMLLHLLRMQQRTKMLYLLE